VKRPFGVPEVARAAGDGTELIGHDPRASGRRKGEIGPVLPPGVVDQTLGIVVPALQPGDCQRVSFGLPPPALLIERQESPSSPRLKVAERLFQPSQVIRVRSTHVGIAIPQVAECVDQPIPTDSRQ